MWSTVECTENDCTSAIWTGIKTCLDIIADYSQIVVLTASTVGDDHLRTQVEAQLLSKNVGLNFVFSTPLNSPNCVHNGIDPHVDLASLEDAAEITGGQVVYETNPRFLTFEILRIFQSIFWAERRVYKSCFVFYEISEIK